MLNELQPHDVAERLERLRALYTPLSEAEARALMEEVPATGRTFSQAAHQRLRELRALSELTRVLHRARPPRIDEG